MWPPVPAGPLAAWQNRASALTTVMLGQPSFFTPRPPQDWFSPNSCVCYYTTSALKQTLERYVDFDRINSARDMRLSVGAVNVRTAQFSYFDSEKITIRPEHVMASGALPPPFLCWLLRGHSEVRPQPIGNSASDLRRRFGRDREHRADVDLAKHVALDPVRVRRPQHEVRVPDHR
jgi:hypothetical protein